MFENKTSFKKAFTERMLEKYGVSIKDSHISERYAILGEMVRDYANVDWGNTRNTSIKRDQKTLIYFSMEFLIGRLLVNNMQNMGIYEVAKEGLKDLGINIHELEEQESDAGLGNGGLGRLAACFLDSIASLGYLGHGNCIRYQYGFFRQRIIDGKQKEFPDQWLTNGNVWEIRRPKYEVEVKFYGNPETYLKPALTAGMPLSQLRRCSSTRFRKARLSNNCCARRFCTKRLFGVQLACVARARTVSSSNCCCAYAVNSLAKSNKRKYKSYVSAKLFSNSLRAETSVLPLSL